MPHTKLHAIQNWMFRNRSAFAIVILGREEEEERYISPLERNKMSINFMVGLIWLARALSTETKQKPHSICFYLELNVRSSPNKSHCIIEINFGHFCVSSHRCSDFDESFLMIRDMAQGEIEERTAKMHRLVADDRQEWQLKVVDIYLVHERFGDSASSKFWMVAMYRWG